jgi:hypothetical protein
VNGKFQEVIAVREFRSGVLKMMVFVPFIAITCVTMTNLPLVEQHATANGPCQVPQFIAAAGIRRTSATSDRVGVFSS